MDFSTLEKSKSMRILWITHCPVYLHESSKENIVRAGWIQGALDGLNDIAAKQGLNYELCIAFPLSPRSKREEFIDLNVSYKSFAAVLQSATVSNKTIEEVSEIIGNYMPDVIHIWGTEWAHTCAVVRAAKKLNMNDHIVISLQGINYLWGEKLALEVPFKYTLGLSIPEIWKRTSLRKLKKVFDKKALYEAEALKNVKYVIGRTTWDNIACKQIASQAIYYHCNETLRNTFYKDDKWSALTCERFSIFVSQGLVSNKGLHQVIKAMPIVMNRFPDAHVYTTGRIGYNNKYGIRAYSSYEKYLIHLMKEYGISNRVSFIGTLSAEEMKKRLLNSNVYICPSSIENECNALSEAKIMGVPSVVAYEGGALNRICHGEDGYLYPYNEPNVLAEYICKVFENSDHIAKISQNAIHNQKKINDKEMNACCLIDIYRNIFLNEDKGKNNVQSNEL